jgi:hypothetical protein
LCEHVPKKWIESGIVDVRNDDSFTEIIENHHGYQTVKRFVHKLRGTRRNLKDLVNTSAMFQSSGKQQFFAEEPEWRENMLNWCEAT